MAKHPVTKPEAKVIRNSEKKIEDKIEEMVREAINTAEIIEIDE